MTSRNKRRSSHAQPSLTHYRGGRENVSVRQNMKPLEHAQRDVAHFGGVEEDYLPIHDFFDQTKAFIPDMRHRAVLHNAWGIFLCERMFGPSLTNKDGK